MTAFLFATIAAVSREDQASEDKDSLEYQIKVARAFGEHMGGTFTRDYRAEGFSRSGWYDLTPALEQCQGFYELARDARKHAFDVVIVENYDRLGDLAFAFFNYFADCGAPFIQLRSVVQKLMIEEPAAYHPRRDESTVNAIADALKVNKYRTDKIFRGFDMGNAKRARDGKYATQVPYGYVKVDKSSIVIDPVVAPLLQKLVAMYLAGSTMSEVVRHANASGVPAKKGGKWWDHVIEMMFKSPFYAGKTYYKRWASDEIGNYRLGKELELYDGKHEPLWSYETHLQLVAEIKRRHRDILQPRDYNFTGLLKCAECGDVLHITYNPKLPHLRYWRCDNKHVSIRVDRANALVAAELVRLLGDREYKPTVKAVAQDMTARGIKAVESQIRRLDEAYRFGSHTPQAYALERQGLTNRLKDLQNEAQQEEEARRKMSEFEKVEITLRSILDDIPGWIAEWNPREVKYNLSRYVTLTVYPDHTIRAERISPPV